MDVQIREEEELERTSEADMTGIKNVHVSWDSVFLLRVWDSGIS